MTTTTTNNESIGSRYLANYIRNVQQANEGTAAQYEYRLSKFEKYIVTASEEERQQERQQQQNQILLPKGTVSIWGNPRKIGIILLQ
jgi:hypothetical protein